MTSAPHEEKTAKAPGKARRRRPPWIAFTIAGALLVAGLVSGATVAGWAAANTLVVASSSSQDPEVVTIALPDYDADVTSRMPDLRGLARDAALQVIADAGIPAGIVEVIERPAAGPVGLVVQQTPVFGSANPGTIVLVVSLPAEIPDGIGADAVATIARLQELGARVTQQRDYVPGAVVGTITAIDPAPGSPVPDAVTVTIADSPSTLPFGEVDTASGSAGSDDDVLVGGMLYSAATVLSSSTAGQTTAWNLGAHVVSVDGAIGVPDSADDETRLRVSVHADGRAVAEYVLGRASAEAFSWDVRGVTTLTITVVDESRSREGAYLLDTNVLGTYDQLGELTTR